MPERNLVKPANIIRPFANRHTLDVSHYTSPDTTFSLGNHGFRREPVDAAPDDALAGAWRTCTYMLYEPPADAAERRSAALGVPVEPLEDVIELPDSMNGLERFMGHSSLLEPRTETR